MCQVESYHGWTPEWSQLKPLLVAPESRLCKLPGPTELTTQRTAGLLLKRQYVWVWIEHSIHCLFSLLCKQPSPYVRCCNLFGRALAMSYKTNFSLIRLWKLKSTTLLYELERKEKLQLNRKSLFQTIPRVIRPRRQWRLGPKARTLIERTIAYKNGIE